MAEPVHNATFTPDEVITTILIGAAVIGTAYVLGRARRWWQEIDPFARPRERIVRTSTVYRGSRDTVTATTDMAHAVSRLFEAVQALSREAAQ
jgi:hypothetical protein